MPKIETHVATSTQRTGRPYREVHEWIDDPAHKNERHDITRVLEFSAMFREQYGEQGAQEYVQHLADDLNGKFGHLLDDVGAGLDSALRYFGARK